jgi:hypothetical protein
MALSPRGKPAVPPNQCPDADVYTRLAALEARPVAAPGPPGPQGPKGDPGGIPEAPQDGKLYGRQNAKWVEVTGSVTPPQPEPPQPEGPSKDFVIDFSAPTDGTSDCQTALQRWIAWAKDKSNPTLTIPAGKFVFLGGFKPFGGLGIPAAGDNFVRGGTIQGAGSSLTEILPNTYCATGVTEVFMASVATSGFLNSAKPGDTTVTLKSAADVGKFHVNGWVCIAGLSLMTYGYPPNIQYVEYHKVTAINGSTLTLDAPLRETYLDTWPLIASGSDPNALGSQMGGPAIAFALHDAFDGVFRLKGFTITPTTSQCDTFYNGREHYNEDIVWNNQPGTHGPAPTMAQKATFVNCTIKGDSEIDKMCEKIEFINCNGATVLNQSTSNREMLLDNCTFNWVVSTVRRTTVRNGCQINMLQAGAGFYGAAESLTIQDSTIKEAQASYHYYNTQYPITFANGIFMVPKNNSNAYAEACKTFVPGHSYLAGAYSGYAATQNEAGPDFKFKVVAVREDASYIYIETDRTDLGQLPPMAFAGGQPCQGYFCIPLFTVSETNYTGPSYALLTTQCNPW